MKERPESHRITDIAASERPRERLAKLGPHALSNAELLAILLRVGVQGKNAVDVGRRVLSQFGSISGLLRPVEITPFQSQNFHLSHARWWYARRHGWDDVAFSSHQHQNKFKPLEKSPGGLTLIGAYGQKTLEESTCGMNGG